MRRIAVRWILVVGAVFVVFATTWSRVAAAEERPHWTETADCGKELSRGLTETRITADFEDQSVGDIVDYLATAGGVNIAIAPHAFYFYMDGDEDRHVSLVQAKWTAKYEDTPLRDVLRDLTESLRIFGCAHRELVLLSNGGLTRSAADPLLDQAVRQKLAEVRVSADFHKTPFSSMAKALRELGGRDILLDFSYAWTSQSRITFKARDMTLENWAEWTARFCRVRWTVRGEAIVFTDSLAKDEREMNRRLDERRVSFDFQDRPLGEVLDFFRQASGIENLEPDPRAFPAREGVEVHDAVVTAKATDVTLRDALITVGKAVRLGKVVVVDQLVLLTDREIDPMPRPQGPEEILRALDERSFCFTFNELPFGEAVHFLEELGKVPVDLDAVEDARTVSLTVRCMRFSSALNWLCRFNDLTWTVEEGRIVVKPRVEKP